MFQRRFAWFDLIRVTQTVIENILNVCNSFVLEEIAASMCEFMTLTIVDQQICLVNNKHFRELLLLTKNGVEDA